MLRLSYKWTYRNLDRWRWHYWHNWGHCNLVYYKFTIYYTVFKELYHRKYCENCFLPSLEIFILENAMVYLDELERIIWELFKPQSPCFQIQSYFWSAFFCVWTEYGDLRSNLRIQPKYRKIGTRNNSVFGHFPRSGIFRLTEI